VIYGVGMQRTQFGRKRRENSRPQARLASACVFFLHRSGIGVSLRRYGSNLGYERTFEFGDIAAALGGTDLVVEETLHWGRSAGMPMETTGAIARPGTNGVLEIYCNSLNFSYLQFLLAAALRIPSNKLKMQPVPAGGSFGSKFTAYKVRRWPRSWRCAPGVRCVTSRTASIT
jgi:CO/xanthine dehydrogenase Mo-binding subunit